MDDHLTFLFVHSKEDDPAPHQEASGFFHVEERTDEVTHPVLIPLGHRVDSNRSLHAHEFSRKRLLDTHLFVQRRGFEQKD